MSKDSPGDPVSRYPPVSRFLDVRGLRLHYLDWGNTGAPILLLIHGSQDHAHSWDDVARALSDTWHVLCPDLRGHGDSDWSPDGAYMMPFYVEDLAALVAHLGGGPLSIIGHSLGGAITLRQAALFPRSVSRIVVIEGLGPSPKRGQAQAQGSRIDPMRDWISRRSGAAAQPHRAYHDVEEALARMRAVHPRLTERVARHLTVHALRRRNDGTVSWKFDPLTRAMAAHETPAEEFQAIWQAVECPTLLVYGRDSWASNPVEDGRAAHFRDARTLLFDGAGHWVQHDRFDAFLAVTRSFLSGAEADMQKGGAI